MRQGIQPHCWWNIETKPEQLSLEKISIISNIDVTLAESLPNYGTLILVVAHCRYGCCLTGRKLESESAQPAVRSWCRIAASFDASRAVALVAPQLKVFLTSRCWTKESWWDALLEALAYFSTDGSSRRTITADMAALPDRLITGAFES